MSDYLKREIALAGAVSMKEAIHPIIDRKPASVNPLPHLAVLLAIIQHPGYISCELLTLLPDIPRRTVFNSIRRLHDLHFTWFSDVPIIMGRGKPARKWYAVPWVAANPAAALTSVKRVTLNRAEGCTKYEKVAAEGCTKSPSNDPPYKRPRASGNNREENNRQEGAVCGSASMKEAEVKAIAQLFPACDLTRIASTEAFIADLLAGKGKPEEEAETTVAQIREVAKWAIQERKARSFGYLRGNGEYDYWTIRRDCKAARAEGPTESREEHTRRIESRQGQFQPLADVLPQDTSKPADWQPHVKHPAVPIQPQVYAPEPRDSDAVAYLKSIGMYDQSRSEIENWKEFELEARA